MHNITLLRGIALSALSVTNGKFIFKNLKLSCISLNQWRILSPAVLRTSANFSESAEASASSLNCQWHLKPHQSTCNKEKTKVKWSGIMNCHNENSATWFVLGLIKPFDILETNNFHDGFETDTQKKKNYLIVTKPTLLDLMLHLNVLNYTDDNQPVTVKQSNDSHEKSPEENLEKIYNHLCDDLPNVFVKALDYGIYSKNVIFENRINGTRTEGIVSYIRQAHFLRIVGHFKYAYVKFDILKITKHPEDSTIRVRWRITGLSALKSFGLVWRLKTVDTKSVKDQMTQWHDGFSVFYVGSDGLVFKHVADKMFPDEEIGVVKNSSLITRITTLISLERKAASPQSAMNAAELSNKMRNITLKNQDTASFVLGDLQHMIIAGSEQNM